jgi:hypothetical protein
MRRTSQLLGFAFLLFACVSLPAQTNKAYLNRIASARFIQVVTENGDPFDPVIDAQDRRAVGEIQNKINEWKTFTLVYRKEDADIVIAVRTAGRVRANAGIHVSNTRLPGSNPSGIPGSTSPSIGPVLQADASSAKDDLFSVYEARDYPTSAILWRRQQKEGLSIPGVPLFNQFKKDVEKAIAVGNKKP